MADTLEADSFSHRYRDLSIYSESTTLALIPGNTAARGSVTGLVGFEWLEYDNGVPSVR
jgi:hypothetical protein